MKLFLWVLGLLLILFLVYALVVGLGLARIFHHHKSLTRVETLDDFEYPNDDFDWTTGGYVKLEPSSLNQTHGKMSCKATFFLSSQFEATPTPAPTPVLQWKPSMVMDVNSITRLPDFDWSDYDHLKMDVFNPQNQPVTYYLDVADSRSFVYETQGTLTPMKVTNISVDFQDLIGQRLDLTNIRSLSFGVDVNGFSQPVSLYLDYVRLEGSLIPAKK